MKKMIGMVFLFLLAGAALADGTMYHLFADGLACEPCAMDIDKQLRAIDGVQRVQVLAELGVVNVRVADGHVLVEKQVSRVLADAGVTFRRLEKHPVGGGNSAALPSQRLESQESSL